MNGLSLAACLALATPGLADTIYQTNDPFGGQFGLIGFDVSQDQRAACRFTPGAEYTLDRVSIWFMNNGEGRPSVTVSLQAEVNGVPGGVALESWTFPIQAVGWNPVFERMDSTAHTALHTGTNYWIVAESSAPGGADPVWNWPSTGAGYTAIDNNGSGWSAGSGATGAMTVEGSPAGAGCIADFNHSGGTPDDADIAAFFAAWNEGDGSADVNASGGTPDDADIAFFFFHWNEGC